MLISNVCVEVIKPTRKRKSLEKKDPRAEDQILLREAHMYVKEKWHLATSQEPITALLRYNLYTVYKGRRGF